MTRQVGEATERPLEASLNDLDNVIFSRAGAPPIGRAGATHRGWMGAGDWASVRHCRSRGKA